MEGKRGRLKRWDGGMECRKSVWREKREEERDGMNGGMVRCAGKQGEGRKMALVMVR